jgi:hypothetical protein
VKIRASESAPGAGDHKDAIFLSPHKFIGGPQTPGVLIVRRNLVRNRIPTAPGGGTVTFVTPDGHRYLDDPVMREEGGTPAIVESIRAGLVFALKQAVGTETIQASEERLWKRALARWSRNPHIEVLGSPSARRLSIASLCIRHHDRYLHHNYVVSVLNDLYGIQARGGCSCAGPYRHRLLAIGPGRSQAFRDQISEGWQGIKPGWTRVNFNYFISDTVADYLIDATDQIASYGYRLLPEYRFDPATGLWLHRNGIPKPPLRLRDLTCDHDGITKTPARRARAGEDALAGYLRLARELLAARPEHIDQGSTGLPENFEALRWFSLPPACLTPADPASP